jgi:PAS domain S-box-containing protein
MNVSKRINTLLIPLLLIVVLGGPGTAFWLSRHDKIAARTETVLRPGVQAFVKTRAAVAQYADQQQARILAGALGQTVPGTEPRLDPAELVSALQLSLQQEKQDVAELEGLRQNLIKLVTTGKEINIRLTPTPAEEKLAGKAARNNAANAKAELAERNTILNALSSQLGNNQDEVFKTLDALQDAHEKKIAEATQQAARAYFWGYVTLGIATLLAVVWCVVALLGLRRGIANPLDQLLYRLSDKSPLPQDATQFGQIGWFVNQIRAENKRIEEALAGLGRGQIAAEYPSTEFTESMALELGNVARLIQSTQTNLKELQVATQKTETNLKDELAKLRKAEQDKQAALAKLEGERTRLLSEQDQLKLLADNLKKDLDKTTHEFEQNRVEFATSRAKLAAVENSLAIAELDGEGKLVYTDNFFAKLAGYTPDELKGLDIVQLNGGTQDKDFYAKIMQTVGSGQTWYGVFQNRTKSGADFWLASVITPIVAPKTNGSNGNGHTNGNGSGNGRYLLAGYEISALKHQEQQLRNSLETVSAEIDRYRSTVDNLKTEQTRVLQNYQQQKQLENRLVQQQSALTELTRNADLKEGNVREALRSITEITAYALDDNRMGLWLFTENGTKLRCLDVYDRQRLQHRDSIELKQQSFPDFFGALQKEGVMAITSAPADERTRYLYPTYLQPNGVQSLMSAPIHLGGEIVGVLMAEHTGTDREWALDEQNFLMSVADVVSLALEQGNRKVMEEELRMTLEESQALEEELRQNAEEIEATNEEMKRTQVELRGQISALNNSAIVSETNPDGSISYCNAEFGKVYGLDRSAVMGQNHRLLKSGHHPPVFYQHMWATISSGKVWKGEVKNKAADGSEIWVLLTITPVMGIDNKPYKFIGVSYNITAQKLQEEQIKNALEVALQQEELLRQNAEELEYANDEMRRTQIELAGQVNALNNSSMVYETDMEGNVTYVNDELLETSRYTREDLIGKRYTILKSGRQPDALYQEQWRTVLNGRIWRGELELKSRDGQYFWVIITNTPVLDDGGEPIKSINVLFDITAQKQQEFRLKKQQSALLELTSHPAIKEGNVTEAFKVITKIGMETLGVNRASIWQYDDTGTTITCVAAFQSDDNHFNEPGTKLDREAYPIYFRTLERDRVIAANDANADPRTREMVNTLFSPLGVSAVLDSSVRQGPRTVGVISFEHRGSVRPWTLDEQSFATSLADTIGLVLEQKERQLTEKLKLAYTQLEDINQEVLRQKNEIEEQATHLRESIRYAKRIQQNILPSKDLIGAHLPNYFIVYKPRDVVGGDFYYFSNIGSHNVVVVADGTGHGVPGAFLTLIGYLLLNQIVNEKRVTKPSDILYHLHIGVRTALKQDEEGSESRDGMDVAVVTFDSATYMAQFAGANLPFNYYQDWDLHTIKPDKQSIGGEQMEEERTFTNHEVQLKPGDGVYLYTDGFVDQMGGPEEKRFSTRRFRDLVLRTQHESMATQRALVNIEWKEWKDDREQLDDVTVFGFKV